MNQNILKDFIENRIYREILKHSKSDIVTRKEMIHIMSFVRIDKKTTGKLLIVLEENGLIKIMNERRGKIKLLK